MANSTRVIVLSDLHLGGDAKCMMSHPDRLAAFVNSLPVRLGKDEDLELVIAGDFVDFLAIQPYASWTPNPVEAIRKLETVMNAQPFGQVFDALSTLISEGGQLTVIVGNHDVELGLPQVQQALLQRLGAKTHQIHFVDDGKAYCIGRALIEHGNRYDNANVNDWNGLRAISSALSRAEEPNTALEVSAGSVIVEKVVNPIRQRYPFLDLLQPCGELLAFLFLSFEPSLKWDIGKMARILRGQRLQNSNKEGRQPGKTRNVSYSHLDERDDELAQAFGPLYGEMQIPKEDVGIFTDWIGLYSAEESLSEILRRGDPIPHERLKQIRVVMRRLLLDDVSSRWDADTEQYGEAAKQMLENAQGVVEVVVMGHTHLARHIGPESKANYINTGTWADVIRVPKALLEPGTDKQLEDFLRSLNEDNNRDFLPTYADLLISVNGSVCEARLRSVKE